MMQDIESSQPIEDADGMPVDTCTLCSAIQDDSFTRDAKFIVELPHSFVFVYNDQYFPYRTVVVYREHKEDLLALEAEQAHGLFCDLLVVAAAVARVVPDRRMNYAMLGNRARHLHWHIIPRDPTQADADRAPWPHPVSYLNDAEYNRTAEEIRASIQSSRSPGELR